MILSSHYYFLWQFVSIFFECLKNQIMDNPSSPRMFFKIIFFVLDLLIVFVNLFVVRKLDRKPQLVNQAVQTCVNKEINNFACGDDKELVRTKRRFIQPYEEQNSVCSDDTTTNNYEMCGDFGFGRLPKSCCKQCKRKINSDCS